jgi:hypothetical protein
MATSTLVVHRGARLVERAELDSVPTPPATKSWFPVAHSQVLSEVTGRLADAGFAVRKAQHALSRNDARYFGTLDLESPLVSGVSLAVGIRNSVDKSFPLGFCAGARVFCCDNLAFHSELLVNRKHTRFGQTRFSEAICQAVQSLSAFRETEAERIRRLQHAELHSDQADALILRAYERKLVSHHFLPRVIHEWRKPSFEEFEPRTRWSLLNAFTTVLGARQQGNPQLFASLTMQLQGLLDPETPVAAAA